MSDNSKGGGSAVETLSAIGRSLQCFALETTLLYTHFKGGAEEPELREYPREDKEEDRADPHMEAGWHMFMASTLPLVISAPHIFEWETGSAAGIRSPSIQQPHGDLDSTCRSHSSRFKPELDFDSIVRFF